MYYSQKGLEPSHACRDEYDHRVIAAQGGVFQCDDHMQIRRNTSIIKFSFSADMAPEGVSYG
jgi:hypothetical protein